MGGVKAIDATAVCGRGNTVLTMHFDSAFAARDAALALVLENERAAWRNAAIDEILRVDFLWRGTGEDLRLMLYPQLGEPHHPNVWGAIINSCFRNHILVKTVFRANMHTKISHGRDTPILRRTTPDIEAKAILKQRYHLREILSAIGKTTVLDDCDGSQIDWFLDQINNFDPR